MNYVIKRNCSKYNIRKKIKLTTVQQQILVNFHCFCSDEREAPDAVGVLICGWILHSSFLFFILSISFILFIFRE